MRTHRSFRYTITRTGRSVGRHRREPSGGTARLQATRGIVVPALVLASLGGAAAASHAIEGQAHPTAGPWIYAATNVLK